jgi:hypothetical protein
MRERPNPQLRAKIERQVAALARAIVEGREPLVGSAQRMSRMLYWLGLRSDDDQDAADFHLIVAKTDALPIGAERQYWHEWALVEKDREIARAEAWARGFGLDTCQRLIQRFGNATNRRG